MNLVYRYKELRYTHGILFLWSVCIIFRLTLDWRPFCQKLNWLHRVASWFYFLGIILPWGLVLMLKCVSWILFSYIFCSLCLLLRNREHSCRVIWIRNTCLFLLVQCCIDVRVCLCVCVCVCVFPLSWFASLWLCIPCVFSRLHFFFF